VSRKEFNALKSAVALQAQELMKDRQLLREALSSIDARLKKLEGVGNEVSDSIPEGTTDEDIKTDFTPEIQLIEKYFLELGVDVHDFLRPNIRGGINYSSSGKRTDWVDRNGHGTNVASIIKTVCPEVDLYSVKTVSDSGRGSNEALVRGIDWCIWNGMDVINISLGSQRHYAPLEFKVKEAVEKGIFIACAAGNDYRGVTNTVDYPGRYDESVCTVAALNDKDQHARFSSAGKEIDIAVRGVKIFGAIKAPDIWGYKTGTSQASPHIAGLAASMIRICPDLAPQDIMSIIKDTAIDLGEEGEDNIFGAGLVNPKGVFEHLTLHGDTIKI